MTIWGNHSATQYPDLYTTQVKGRRPAAPGAPPGGVFARPEEGRPVPLPQRPPLI